MTKLERARIERRMSRAGLARASNVSHDTIMRIEREERAENVRIGTYTKLAKALGLHTLDLIEDDLII